jgi:hypothetical protein
MSSTIKLPKSPTVITKDTTVIVSFSNNTELLWGEEKTALEAEKIARELEIELKAVKYVQWHVKNFINDMKTMLSALDIDENLLDSILIDGHSNAREELNNKTVDSIIMNAERGLRQQILAQLGSDDYIV